VDPKEGKKSATHDAYISALSEEFRMYDELLDTKKKKVVGFGIFIFFFVFYNFKQLFQTKKLNKRLTRQSMKKCTKSVWRTAKIIDGANFF
jgi:hypothetical protein